MNPGTIVALISGLTALVTAVTALYHAITAKQQVAASAGTPGAATPVGDSSPPASPPR